MDISLVYYLDIKLRRIKNMTKKFIVICLIVVLTISMFVGCATINNTNDSDKKTTTSKEIIKHYGEAIITQVQREAPSDIYTDSGIVKTDEYKGMTKKMEVYGLTFFASDNIPDEFMTKIAKTFKEMFPKLEGENASKQEEILKNLYRYKACLPIVTEKEIESISVDLINEYSVCDIIMKIKNRQTMEVIEHLLHAITDVGFSYTYPKEWGFKNDSLVSVAMNKAIENNIYNISTYNIDIEDIKQRIIVQEFAYWLITSEWNIQAEYGPNEKEWIARNSNEVAEKLPDADKLFKNYANNLISCPSKETLKLLSK